MSALVGSRTRGTLELPFSPSRTKERYAVMDMPMHLDMKTNCEKCGHVLPADGSAYICSYECTFCCWPGPLADLGNELRGMDICRLSRHRYDLRVLPFDGFSPALHQDARSGVQSDTPLCSSDSLCVRILYSLPISTRKLGTSLTVVSRGRPHLFSGTHNYESFDPLWLLGRSNSYLGFCDLGFPRPHV